RTDRAGGRRRTRRAARQGARRAREVEGDGPDHDARVRTARPPGTDRRTGRLTACPGLAPPLAARGRRQPPLAAARLSGGWRPRSLRSRPTADRLAGARAVGVSRPWRLPACPGAGAPARFARAPRPTGSLALARSASAALGGCPLVRGLAPPLASLAPHGRPARCRSRGRRQPPLAAALSLEPTVTLATFVAAIWTGSPVCGLRPVRAARCDCSNVRYPGIVSFSPPLATTCVTSSKKALSTLSTSDCDIDVRSAIAFTRSARVIVVLPSQKRVGGHRTKNPAANGGWWRPFVVASPRILVTSSY